MRLFAGIIVQFLANAIAIRVADALIPGFSFQGELGALARAAAIITALHLVLKPIAKIFLGPFIILSFGLLTLVLNGVLLWLATFWAPEIAIATLWDLLLATLLFTAVNFAAWLLLKFQK